MNSQTTYTTTSEEPTYSVKLSLQETELTNAHADKSPSRKNIFKQADFKPFTRFKGTPTTEYSSLNVRTSQQEQRSPVNEDFSPVRKTAEWLDDQFIQPLLYSQDEEESVDLEDDSKRRKHKKITE